MFYICAYAINSEGTVYGEQISFTTRQPGGGPTTSLRSSPVLTTLQATNVTVNSAVLGVNISNVGNPANTERGFCYSTSQNPTTNNTTIQITGSGTGNFTTTASGLSANTTYYVRAYATNSDVTVYGEQIVFTTENNAPQVRFRKEANDMWMTEMAIDNANDVELVFHYFGTVRLNFER